MSVDRNRDRGDIAITLLLHITLCCALSGDVYGCAFSPNPLAAVPVFTPFFLVAYAVSSAFFKWTYGLQ